MLEAHEADANALEDAVTRFIRLNARRKRLEAEEETLKRRVVELMEAAGLDGFESGSGLVTRQRVSVDDYDFRTLAAILPPTLLQMVSKQTVDARMVDALVARGDVKTVDIAPALRPKTYTRLIVEAKGKK